MRTEKLGCLQGHRYYAKVDLFHQVCTVWKECKGDNEGGFISLPMYKKLLRWRYYSDGKNEVRTFSTPQRARAFIESGLSQLGVYTRTARGARQINSSINHVPGKGQSTARITRTIKPLPRLSLISRIRRLL